MCFLCHVTKFLQFHELSRRKVLKIEAFQFKRWFLLASSPGPTQILSCSHGENRGFSPRLWDKIWVGPGDEARFLPWALVSGSEDTMSLPAKSTRPNKVVINWFEVYLPARVWLCETNKSVCSCCYCYQWTTSPWKKSPILMLGKVSRMRFARAHKNGGYSKSVY